MKVSTILVQIDMGSMALPEFQRGYVWNRTQVRDLMYALYRRHPVGSLLIWETKTEEADVRGDGKLTTGTVNLLLDGQQRITSLYGIIRGAPPPFFEGNKDAFTGLYFNLENEQFEFYASRKMDGNRLWVNVTSLMQNAGPIMSEIFQVPELKSKADTYLNRLNYITNIQAVDFHIDEVTGKDKTVDVVVEIFNKVNSGGTKLSKGDLALAKICAQWTDARQELRQRLGSWQERGFDFRMEWFLRCITTVLTGEAFYTALDDINTPAFRDGLKQTEHAVNNLLNLIGSRLGLDHNRVLGSRYAFPLMAYLWTQREGKLILPERNKLLYWYIHTLLWGRYAGSTESTLSRDLTVVQKSRDPFNGLISELRQNRGDLHVRPSDFDSWSRGSRFYPLLYMLTRVHHAQDWESGVALSQHLLGKLSSLQLHHIFPKSLLYDYGYSRAEVNALANFTFLTQETNLAVSNRNPAEYLAEFAEEHPGVLESHWIPMDPELWRIENYLAFLEARRTLLAEAANEFLDDLLAGKVDDEATEAPELLEHAQTSFVAALENEEEITLRECNDWVASHGLPKGEFLYDLSDPETGEHAAILDLAWPEGIQQNLSQSVALLLDEPKSVLEAAGQAGFRYFTTLEEFREYVEEEILGLEEEEID